jgi:hypothetical protein
MTNKQTGQTLQIDKSVVSAYLTDGWDFVLDTLDGQLFNIEVTIGPETSHVINVALQLQTQDETPLSFMASLLAYLSDSPNGKAFTATAPDGGVAIGTNGACNPLVAGKAFLLTFETTGLLDLNIQNSTAVTWYLTIVMPNGNPIVSAAIAF